MTTNQATGTTTGPAAGTAAAAGPLRLFLALDAAVTGANGLIYLLAAGPVGRLLDVDSAFLRATGAFLAVYGVLVAVLAARPVPSAAATKAVIEVNVLWAVAGVAALVLGWLEPSTAGLVWIPLQALVVAAFAALQLGALRKAHG
ncbi:hypothetical protein ABT039_08160 [Streptomyces lasiicapitis]|uniref:Integral membrane protein n=1 Tax=Streptomyces lasiicapitis TaxID=1923961 RepID=A0ABQ2MXI1_9ACTN|nr:hypothetical protein [Streptomyces lasiicapitis]GGO59854.1 hypothetical protein GCM10012286_82410 [Streptomyces lasiicapitis]